ncbi:hypothetical protein [Arcobacter porcinus]|uniref:Uncharacterized protein n=1 Tax=Arcobacter porcinus TaxID=1935204 RepID=A0A5C2HEB3_9BACT|nr:hypothetical protein [Arcobacter porcinus]OCL92403.1 hypothetical protein AAX27_01181 [Aliarcobacter thereius]QEP40534.1 hypothetical protein APORC_0932 [Arcobacter porcinus]
MRKASFSVERRNEQTDIHTQRLNGHNSAIFDNSSFNYFKTYYDYDKFLESAKDKYQQTIKQRMQKSAIENIFQEAIITIDDTHTQNDLVDLFFDLKQRFGGHELINLTIHKDEGYFVKDGINYKPYKNIIKKDEDWYISADEKKETKAENFSLKVDISSFTKVSTPHAHAVFSMFDFKLGRNARMQKKDMVERLKLVADILKLEYALQKIYKILDSNIDITGVKEQELKSLEFKIEARNQELFRINNSIAEKEYLLDELLQKVTLKKTKFNSLSDKISLKNREFEDLITLILTKEDEIDKLQNKIMEKNSDISALDVKIKEREFILEELKQEIELANHLKNI